MPEPVFSDKAPRPVGPYSQAVVHGDLVHTAGQIGMDPATGTLPEGVEEQAEQALTNLEHVLLEAGSGFHRLIKVTIFLSDMSDFSRVNEVYSRKLKSVIPARSAVEVSALPLGALVEIEAVAALKEEQH